MKTMTMISFLLGLSVILLYNAKAGMPLGAERTMVGLLAGGATGILVGLACRNNNERSR